MTSQSCQMQKRWAYVFQCNLILNLSMLQADCDTAVDKALWGANECAKLIIASVGEPQIGPLEFVTSLAQPMQRGTHVTEENDAFTRLYRGYALCSKEAWVCLSLHFARLLLKIINVTVGEHSCTICGQCRLLPGHHRHFSGLWLATFGHTIGSVW